MLLLMTISGEQPADRALVIDESLITKVGLADKEAFMALYRETSGAVYAFALGFLRHREDAEDVMQETFIRIREAAHLYKPEGKPLAWIFTIARNICLMKLRKDRHIADLPPDEERVDDGIDRIADAEDRMVLESALRVLDAEETRIVLLKAVTGLRHREIAELTGLKTATVLSKYNRGIRKLRRELEGKI